MAPFALYVGVITRPYPSTSIPASWHHWTPPPSPRWAVLGVNSTVSPSLFPRLRRKNCGRGIAPLLRLFIFSAHPFGSLHHPLRPLSNVRVSKPLNLFGFGSRGRERKMLRVCPGSTHFLFSKRSWRCRGDRPLRLGCIEGRRLQGGKRRCLRGTDETDRFDRDHSTIPRLRPLSLVPWVQRKQRAE